VSVNIRYVGVSHEKQSRHQNLAQSGRAGFVGRG
jgi:hypothetical protein